MMWSPQFYKEDGLNKGFSEALLDRAIAQTEVVFDSSSNFPSILSLKHLACRAEIDYNELRDFINRKNKNIYKKFSIKKHSGGKRFIHVPTANLMKLQRWLNEYVLKPIPVHSASHAFTQGSSIKRCASRHCGAKWLIKLDIVDFFGSVSEIQVFRLFKELGYQPLISFEMARLCTTPTSEESPRKKYKRWRTWKRNKVIPEYNQKILGYLPQGAATSPLISNLVMKECDEKLNNVARIYGLTYTRYSDDLSFSTRSKDFCRTKARSVVFEVYKILSEAGYMLKHRKTKIIPPNSKKVILGLNVDRAEPRLQKEYKDKIKQHLYYIEKFGINEHITTRKFDSIWGFKSHLRGMIDYANMIEPVYAEKMLHKFKGIDWPV